MSDKNVTDRPYLWKASSGPLFIKSVWMDQGNYRHFILDHDLPKKRTFHALRKSQPIRKINSKVIENELENLQLIGSSEIGQHRNVGDRKQQQQQQQKLCRKTVKNRINLETLKKQLNENIANKNNPEKQQKFIETVTIENSTITTTNDEQKTDETINQHSHPINETTKNQLTERVLNWLDLAGKNTLIRTEPVNTTTATNNAVKTGTNETIKNPKRRVFTTESLTTMKPLRTQLIPLRRAESVHHLSLTLNDDDLDLYNNRKFFEASSRCASAIKFGDFFPATYRCSRKFLAATSYRNRMAGTELTTFPNINQNENGTQPQQQQQQLNQKQQIENERKKKVGKYGFSKMDSAQIRIIENQYKSMIHRQILENSCNRQIAKRQLHIFMPNLPHKKNPAHIDCDSCLSTVISDVSKT